ncbi:hypothetical protein BASA81_012568 [Batrachochytrium salamandrivorans]|nr:hypothetical protein BASA81_012568 [Batrachochytrium salamandrivorans]
MFMSQTRPYSYSKYATGHKPFPVVFTPAPEDEDDYVVAAPFVTTDLSYGTTGVPKMTFCNEQRSLEEGYQCDYNQTKRQVFSQESFSTWYEDDRRFNKRMGYQQRLTLNASTKQYAYRSSNETKDFFDPIQLSDQLDKAWPMSFTETDLNNNKFWFTVEIHTSFQYNGTEVFTFSGDDDVHVFFNER